jgi:hypothetical protein
MQIKVISWREYGLYDECEHDDAHIQAIINEIVKHKYCFSGVDHQNHEFGVPEFNDDTVGKFTQKEWGSLMAAAWNKIDPSTDYDMFDFAYNIPFCLSVNYFNKGRGDNNKLNK